MKDRLEFRPHHFLCALGFVGKGYSGQFTRNMARIVDGTLRADGGDATEITVTFQADSICAPCPARRGAGCSKLHAIRQLDQRHANALGLRSGQTLSWGEAQERIRKSVAPGDLSQLCKNCRWLSMGACEAALRRLHETKRPKELGNHNLTSEASDRKGSP